MTVIELIIFLSNWDYTFKVVEGDLERVYERAEEFETKTRDLETQLREMESKVKETETITVKNADEEDNFEIVSSSENEEGVYVIEDWA